jgi:hypothetical protein
MRISAALLICLFGLNQQRAYAQTGDCSTPIHNCNGRYTTRPCDGVEKPACPDGTGTAAPHDPTAAVRKSLLHELTMKMIDAKRRYGIKVDLTAAQAACENRAAEQKGALAACRAAVDEAELKLRDELSVAVQEQNQERALELQEEENRLRAERNQIEAEKPNVVIVERPRRRRFIRDYPGTVYSGTGHGVTGSYGTSVTVEGSFGNGASGSTTITTGETVYVPRRGSSADGPIRRGTSQTYTDHSNSSQAGHPQTHFSAEQSGPNLIGSTGSGSTHAGENHISRPNTRGSGIQRNNGETSQGLQR